MDGDNTPVRILTVCTHNRTRSVMIEAMLQSMLDRRLGAGRAVVRSAGFGPRDLPPIPDAVEAMRARGLDVAGHRSSPLDAAALDGADLVLTAERDHVVRAATMSPSAYRRAMTLPEFLERAAANPPQPADVRSWVEQLTGDRTTADYLRDHVGEIADPTGTARRAFVAAVERIEQQTADAAGWIADAAGP